MTLTPDLGTSDRIRTLLEKKAFSVREITAFNKKSNWMSREDSANDITDFLMPHSEEYFSVLRPVFLHQIRSLDILSRFSPIFSRDGLLSLLYFFHRNPRPPAVSTVLLINRRFAVFVPPRWQPHVAYYTFVSQKPYFGALHQPQSVFILAPILDEKHCSLVHLERRLTDLIQGLGSKKESTKIHLVTFLSQTQKSSQSVQSARSQYFFEIVRTVLEKVGSGLIHTGWSEVRKMNLSKSHFLDLNEFDFYYSDSSVVQHFLRGGSVPFLTPSYVPKPAFTIDTSFFHKIAIETEVRVNDLKHADEIHHTLFQLTQTPLYQEEESAFLSKEFFSNGNKFCPKSFESMAYFLAKRAPV